MPTVSYLRLFNIKPDIKSCQISNSGTTDARNIQLLLLIPVNRVHGPSRWTVIVARLTLLSNDVGNLTPGTVNCESSSRGESV